MKWRCWMEKRSQAFTSIGRILIRVSINQGQRGTPGVRDTPRQRQRVAIARALVNKPSIILADEPTGNLDSKSGSEIMTILDDLHKNGNTIILVTHEDEVAQHAHRIIRLFDGKIIEDSKQDS